MKQTKLNNNPDSPDNYREQTNDLKKGYKQTKLRRIPVDWEYSEIGDKIDLLSGYAFASKSYSTEGTKLLRCANVKRGVTDWSEGITKYWNTDFKNSEKYIMEEGDLVIAMDGSLVGKSYAVIQSCDLPCFLLQRVARIRSTQIDLRFLKEFIGSAYFVRYSDAVKTVTAIPHISSKDIRKFKIPFPPLKEQQKIAAILSTWDSAITAQQKLITQKQQLKRGLMQQLLTGKKRFPAFVKTTAGVDGFTEEWEEVRLGDVGLIQTGNTPSKQNDTFWCGDYNWVTADDMDGKYIEKTIQNLSKKGYAKARIAKVGSILVTCIASIGKNVITSIETGFNQQINSITPNENYNSEFIYYMIDFYPNKLLAFAGAGAMPMLNKNTFMSIKFKFPKLIEQQKIASVLSVADKEIENLQQQLAQLKKQKQGLMQQLLTGKIRVSI